LPATFAAELTGNFEADGVRSMVSLRSISAWLAITWKKKRPDGVPVSSGIRRLEIDETPDQKWRNL
jgi:hypothetical protein